MQLTVSLLLKDKQAIAYIVWLYAGYLASSLRGGKWKHEANNWNE